MALSSTAASSGSHIGLGALFQLFPCLLRHELRHQLRTQLNQRIASAFGGDFFWSLVCLCVLARVTGQTWYQYAQQHRTFAGAHCIHTLRNQRRRFQRPGAVTFDDLQVSEAGQIRRDVAAGRLEIRLHRNAIPVVFDKKQNRQALRGGDRQRRPETVGRD